MSYNLLTQDSLKSVGFPIVDGGRYSQALHDVIVGYRAARRSGSANSKTKADVALSGSKPWRQKGTGRARAGYKSSPVWVGGGVAFGPKPRSYRKSLSKSLRSVALRKALSLRAVSGDLVSVDSFSVAVPKTKDVVRLLGSLGLVGSVLVVSDSFNEFTFLAARNIPYLRLVSSADVNCEDLMRFKKVVLTEGGLRHLVGRVSK